MHPLEQLVSALRMLPGVGPKGAQRIAYHIIRAPRDEAALIASAMLGAKDNIVLCENCMNISESNICPICVAEERIRSLLCIVEEPLDVEALERTGAYRGLYHVLHGRISPMNGIGPNNLKMDELEKRLHSGQFKEVILATNPNMEGEATAMYIHKRFLPALVKVTKLARGLPSGSDLEYADSSTLSHALTLRTEFFRDG